MKVYVAGVSGEKQYLKSLNSFYELRVRPSDSKNLPQKVMRGDVARMTFCDSFLESDKDALLLLDCDMVHPPDLLERLREWDKDMVTAHYWKRTTPMESVCSVSPDGTWPYLPLDVRNLPLEGLVEIDSSGFGAVLIKREVIQGVRSGLGEEGHPFALGNAPEMSNGENVHFGSDMRFFHRTRELGYKLWLDCGLESLHASTFWLSRELYERLREPEWEGQQLWLIHQINKKIYGDNPKTVQIKLEQFLRDRQALDDKITALQTWLHQDGKSVL